MQSIQFKRTGVSGKVPTPEQLQVGEIALQLSDHVIFTKDKNHKVVQISVSPETHDALESKVDANKKELDQTIALNDQNINAKVDEIKTTTDETIRANDEAIHTKVDTIKRETDATILANKNKAADDLAGAVEELNTTIATNKDIAAVALEEVDTRLNKKIDDIRQRTDETIAANDLAINEKVDLIKAETDRTIADNAQHAQNQLEDTFNHLTGVIEANKEEATEAVTALSTTVEAKDAAIHKKVDGNKTHSDSEIARLDARIDNIDGSSDGKFIKMNYNTATEGHLLSRTANYSDNPEVQETDYLKYFGAYRVNGMDNWGETTGLLLNVPHSAGKQHGRGFEFQYGSAGSHVRTYGIGADGVKAFSHRMYHEGDKPTPAELNVYSKDEVNKLFQKTLWIGPAGGWFKIASFTMGQNWGKELIIRLVGGNGYNLGQIGQTNIYELVVRNSNDNPKGINFTVFQHMAAYDQEFCIVNTSGDNYEIYVFYFEHTVYTMAQYQASTDVNLVVHDNPERFAEKPTGDNVTNAVLINMFNSHRNRGTLKFQGNGHNEYDIEHLVEAPNDGKKYIRRFRSSQPAKIWHETVENGDYRLATGSSDDDEQLLIQATGGNKGGLVSAGRFTARGGNDAFKVHYDPDFDSAMMQFWAMPTGKLNSYIGYGDKKVNMFSIVNTIGAVGVNTPNSYFELHSTGLYFGNSTTAEPSSQYFKVRNWGNGNDRPAVLEVSDGLGWHFFTQRRPNGNVEFESAGTITAHNGINARGGSGLTIHSDGNRHVWFRDNAGNEKGLIYADNNGTLAFRCTYGGTFEYAHRHGMIHMHNAMLPYAGDLGLIRGHIAGGAWDAWRDRPAGLLVDCQDSQSQAYNIWKATHWGQYHIAAMGVHAGGGNAHVILHVGGVNYSFAHNGDFTAAAAVYCNDVYIRSDRRLKINVEDYKENAIDKVNTLKVKTYDKVRSLKDREVLGREVGIIAQDLQKVLPEAVSVKNIANQDEEPEEILTISNSSVNALLIKAIQEMSAKMDSMSKEIEELKARVK